MSINLAEGPQEEDQRDNLGASAARAASEALIEAAEHVRALTGTESGTLLVGLQRRLTDLASAVEELAGRQISGAMIREAHRREDFAAGWDACLLARHGLHAV